MDEILATLASATGPLDARAIAFEAGIERRLGSRTFERFLRAGLLVAKSKPEARGILYSLNPAHPIFTELQALLLRLSGTRVAVGGESPISQEVAGEKVTCVARIFRGVEGTTVLRRLAHGPVRRVDLVRENPHLDRALSSWLAAGIVV